MSMTVSYCKCSSVSPPELALGASLVWVVEWIFAKGGMNVQMDGVQGCKWMGKEPKGKEWGHFTDWGTNADMGIGKVGWLGEGMERGGE